MLEPLKTQSVTISLPLKGGLNNEPDILLGLPLERYFFDLSTSVTYP